MRAEWGPGLYGTTSYFRASTYAKGGKVTQLVEYQPRLLLADAALGLDTATDFVRDNAPRSKQPEILARLQACSENPNARDKHAIIGTGDPLFAEVLLNLWVNSGLSTGVKGPALSEFYAAHGIDAYSDRVSGLNGDKEFWTVIFNPDAITESCIVSAADVPNELWVLPDPRESMGLTIADVCSELETLRQPKWSAPRMG